MKIRNGFISNSSSSSFIIFTRCDLKTKRDLQEWFVDSTVDKSKLDKNKRMRDAVKSIKQLKKNKSLSKDEYDNIMHVLTDYDCFLGKRYEYTYRSPLYVSKVIFDNSFDENKNLEELQFKDGYPEGYESRKLYKISKWREQLDDKNSFIYNLIRNNIEYDLNNKLQKLSETDRTNKDCDLVYLSFAGGSIFYEYENSKSIRDFINDVTENVIKRIKEEEIYKDGYAYFIDWCTDDGKATVLDYAGRAGRFSDTADYSLRWEKS